MEETKERRAKGTLRRLLPFVLIAAGVVVMAVALYQRAETGFRQRELIERYLDYSESLAKGGSSGEAVLPPPSDQTTTKEEAPPPTENETQGGDSLSSLPNPDVGGEKSDSSNYVPPALVGILHIPKLDVTVAVGADIGSETLKYAVGHFPETALPGGEGNCAIVGHRNYVYGQFFRYLDRLAKGDEIILQSGGRSYTYLVTENFTVTPDEVWVLDPTDRPTVTLVTCTPIGNPTHRLIVRGELKTEG